MPRRRAAFAFVSVVVGCGGVTAASSRDASTDAPLVDAPSGGDASVVSSDADALPPLINDASPPEAAAYVDATPFPPFDASLPALPVCEAGSYFVTVDDGTGGAHVDRWGQDVCRLRRRRESVGRARGLRKPLRRRVRLGVRWRRCPRSVVERGRRPSQLDRHLFWLGSLRILRRQPGCEFPHGGRRDRVQHATVQRVGIRQYGRGQLHPESPSAGRGSWLHRGYVLRARRVMTTTAHWDCLLGGVLYALSKPTRHLLGSEPSAAGVG